MIGIWWRLSLLGLVGAASLALAPLERLAPPDLDPALIRLLGVIQPAVLVLAFTALGAWLAPKVGLDAPVVRAWAERRPVAQPLSRQIVPAVLAGLAVGIMLIGYWAYIAAQPFGGELLGFQVPLLTKLLYGGIVEELLLRWGLMSFLVWGLWRLGGGGAVRAWCYWSGAALASLVFAAGHLPLLSILLPDPPASLVALVLAANALPGLLFGWLFWRRGLEAAMIAHACAHLFATIVIALIQ